MLRFPSLLRLSAAVALVLPAALKAQTPDGSASGQRRVAATVTIAADPWLVIYRGSATTQQSRLARTTVRANVDELDAALEPYGTRYNRLNDEERALVRDAFVGVVPRQRFSAYRLNEPQAKSIVFLALGPVERLQPVCERGNRPDWSRGRDGDRGRGWDGDRNRDRDVPPPAPAPAPPRPPRSAACQSQLDTLSRDAAWIRTTILAMGRTGSNRQREQEQADLASMSERARAMVLSANRCGCPAAAADADSLLTATREALDKYNATGMAAWMTLGVPRVERISKLSDALERTFIRCLSE